MANHQTQKFGVMLKESLEQAQARLTTWEEEAQKVMHGLLDRSHASRKEVAGLLRKVNARKDRLESEYVKEISGRARHVGADVTARLEDLRERAIAVAGVASREQVDELHRDLDRLARKLDKLLSGAGKGVKRDTKAV
jgi:polyhydroxyalkanoate synthesis regulator phasin